MITYIKHFPEKMQRCKGNFYVGLGKLDIKHKVPIGRGWLVGWSFFSCKKSGRRIGIHLLGLDWLLLSNKVYHSMN